MPSYFPQDVLHEILDLIESVPEDFSNLLFHFLFAIIVLLVLTVSCLSFDIIASGMF